LETEESIKVDIVPVLEIIAIEQAFEVVVEALAGEGVFFF
jgi:hypothetical protein